MQIFAEFGQVARRLPSLVRIDVPKGGRLTVVGASTFPGCDVALWMRESGQLTYVSACSGLSRVPQVTSTDT